MGDPRLCAAADDVAEPELYWFVKRRKLFSYIIIAHLDWSKLTASAHLHSRITTRIQERLFNYFIF